MSKEKGLLACFSLIIIVILAGCKELKVAPDKISLAALGSAPEQIEISGRKYVLESYLWRDFMPPSPPEGQPLMVVVKIVGSDTLAFPTTLSANHLWIIKDKKEIWETEFTSENRSGEINKLEKSASGGPKWPIGIEVDVVVRIIDVRNNKFYLLRASKQKITRTD